MSEAFFLFDTGHVMTPKKADRKVVPFVTTPAFDAFWKSWPSHFRKDDRRACFRHWAAAGLESISAQVMTALALWKRCDQWTKNDGEFISAPLVWLHKERWQVTIESFPELRGQMAANRPSLPRKNELYDG